MIPTVNHQLEAMLDTMTRFVMPVIPADERFAQEQAGLIIATLGWLVDVNESQHAYEVAEHADQVALGVALLELCEEPDVRAAVEDDLPADATLEQIRTRTRRLKAVSAAALEGAEDATEVTRLFLETADRQVEREQAWCRMTGMPKNVTGAIGDVLAAQS